MFMKDAEFWVRLEPVEDLYGGGYRTKHVILKRRHAALAQSVYSCSLRDKMAPNRDYPYEGLYGIVNGDNWKFIDSIAIGLKMYGRSQKLKPLYVQASPWACEYAYGSGTVNLYVFYYLFDTAHGGSGIMEARAEGPAEGLSLVFEPFFDIRFMYDASEPGSHVPRLIDDTLAVSVGEKTACVRLDGGSPSESNHRIEWKYKLGSGYRARAGGDIRPVPETRPIVSFYELETQGATASLRFTCAGTGARALDLLGEPAGDPEHDLTRARSMADAVFPHGADSAVVLRALAMSRFGIDVDGAMFQEAGEFWFKSVWFRDQFEGLIQNYHTIKRMNGLGCIRDILLSSYELQDKWGRLPNRYAPGKKLNYDSADATLLAFILAGILVRDSNDGELAGRSAHAMRKYLDGVCSCDLAPDGPPMLKPNGLISVAPWHSWTDGHRMLGKYRVPIRVSEAWERELIEKGQHEELLLQKYLLPEINAQWIRCLEAGWLFSKFIRDFKLADRCKMYYYKAMKAFKPLFFNEDTGFVDNLATTDESALGRRSDPTVGSPGMVAAAMLGIDMFSTTELGRIVEMTKSRLLKAKWGMPFGVAVKDSATCVYLSDSEYHEGVVWPRDTPYLIKLLRTVGDNDTVDLLLESNLRHQMEEGFVFYNGELFSCDHDMVPVKDPVQWWSQWVDPYLEKYQRK